MGRKKVIEQNIHKHSREFEDGTGVRRTRIGTKFKKERRLKNEFT